MKGPDGKPAPRFARLKGRLPPQLVRCPGCGLHLFPQARTCPHCGGDLQAMGKKRLAAIKRAQRALKTLGKILDAQK